MSLIDQEQKYLLFRSEEITDHHKERNDHKRGQHFVTLTYDNVVVESGYKVLPEAMPDIYRASYQDLKTFYNSTTEELSSFVPFVTLYVISGSDTERQMTRLYFGDPSTQLSVGAITSPSHLNRGAGIVRLTVDKKTNDDVQTVEQAMVEGEIEFKLTDFNQIFVNRTDPQDMPYNIAKLIDIRRLNFEDGLREFPNILIEYGWTIPGDENATRAGIWRDSFQCELNTYDLDISEDGSISLKINFHQTFSENLGSRNILMSNVDEEEEINYEEYIGSLRRELEANNEQIARERLRQEARQYLLEHPEIRQRLIRSGGTETTAVTAQEASAIPNYPLLRAFQHGPHNPNTRIDEDTVFDITGLRPELVAEIRSILQSERTPTGIVSLGPTIQARIELLEQQRAALSVQLAEQMNQLYSRFLLSLYNKGRVYYVDIPSEVTNAEAIRQAQAARARSQRLEPTPAIAGGADPIAVTAAQLELNQELSSISIPDEEIAYKFCVSPDKFGVVPQQDIENIRTASAGEIDRAAEDQAREVDAETRNTDNPGILVKDASNFLNQASSEYDPPKENTTRVQYLLLGDIIDSAMAFVGREDLIESIRDPRLILGPVDLRTLGANISSEKYASSYNIPISLRGFNSFFFRNYINKEKTIIHFQNFIVELYKQLVGLNYPVVDGVTLTTESRPSPRSSLNFHSFRVPTNKDITTGQVISTPPYRGHRNFTMPDISTDMTNLAAGLNKRTYHYISIGRGDRSGSSRNSARGPLPLTSIHDINYDAAARFGVPTLFYGTEKSVVKSVTYSNESMPDAFEEAAAMESGYAGGHKIYTAQVETFGNCYFGPFTCFWLEPTNITGPGEGNYRQIRQSLYDHYILYGYECNQVTEEVTLDGFYTKFSATQLQFLDPEVVTENDTRPPVACEEREEPTTPSTPSSTPEAQQPSSPSITNDSTILIVGDSQAGNTALGQKLEIKLTESGYRNINRFSYSGKTTSEIYERVSRIQGAGDYDRVYVIAGGNDAARTARWDDFQDSQRQMIELLGRDKVVWVSPCPGTRIIDIDRYNRAFRASLTEAEAGHILTSGKALARERYNERIKSNMQEFGVTCLDTRDCTPLSNKQQQLNSNGYNVRFPNLRDGTHMTGTPAQEIANWVFNTTIATSASTTSSPAPDNSRAAEIARAHPGQGVPSSQGAVDWIPWEDLGSPEGGPERHRDLTLPEAELVDWSTHAAAINEGLSRAVENSTSNSNFRGFDYSISVASRLYNIPEAVIRAFIRVESNFRTDRPSPRGAIGPGQIMPVTARTSALWQRGRELEPGAINGDRLNVENSHVNILTVGRFIRFMANDRYGAASETNTTNRSLAHIAYKYNAGQNLALPALNSPDNVTKATKYAGRILRNYWGYASGSPPANRDGRE